ncbi:MAG: hypothetical protein IK094_02075, partial [Treponema sp.]|nr:hypothetical protein [Treponema sp.]
MELLKRGLGEDFSSRVDELEKLVDVNIWKECDFIPCGKFNINNTDEVRFANFSMNEAYHFVGEYFKKDYSSSDMRVWCGCHVPYGFLVSFWSADDLEKEKFHEKLGLKNLDVQDLYSGAKIKGKGEKSWYS